MTLQSFLAQAAAAPASGAASGGTMAQLLASPLPLLVVMFALFYFMIIRPQQKQAKMRRDAINAVKRGDSVILSSGIKGKVVRVEDNEVGVEIATGVTVKVIKTMLADIDVKGAPAPANDTVKSK